MYCSAQHNEYVYFYIWYHLICHLIIVIINVLWRLIYFLVHFSINKPLFNTFLQVEPAASMASSALSPPMSSLPPPPPLNHQASPDCLQTNDIMGSNSSGSAGNAGSSASMISTECSLCGDLITDRFILQVANRSWHANCLRCNVCHAILDGQTSCFLRDELLYCKSDYTK